MPETSTLRLGTRGSPLARWQAEWVAARLAEHGIAVSLVHISTQGDVKTGALSEIGGQGLFTKEIQRALLAREIDLAVHSLKDLPTDPVAGLTLGAVPERESVGDVLVSHGIASVDALPRHARIGTGSTRRRAQLLHVRPDLQMLDIRGNVDTRLRKLDDGDFDAIVLAEAGLKRLGLGDRIVHVIPQTMMLPAVGQGALGIEIRDDDDVTRQAVAPLNHAATREAIVAERALLATLRGGCMAPVGAWGRIEADTLKLDGVVLSHDGARRLFATAQSEPDNSVALGIAVAEQLLAQGAAELIADARNS